MKEVRKIAASYRSVISIAKPIQTILWTLVFLSLWFLVINLALRHLQSVNYFGDSMESRLLRYNNELLRYRTSVPWKAKTVVVGPSYVSYLGIFDGDIYNLGYPSASPHEVERVVNDYCGRNDRVLHGLTLWHFLALKEPIRELPFSMRQRNRFILSAYLGGVRPKVPKFSQHQVDLFAAIPDEDIKDCGSFFKALRDSHPNFQVVLFPVRPDIPEIRPKVAVLKSTLIDNDISVLDLSYIVIREEFRDLFHTTPRGTEITKQIITEFATCPF